MKQRKIVIVGGVAGGATAAARLRRLDEQAEIIMFERGVYFVRELRASYYIGGVIPKRQSLLVQTPRHVEAVPARYSTEQEVTAIDRERHIVSIRNGKTGSSTRNRMTR